MSPAIPLKPYGVYRDLKSIAHEELQYLMPSLSLEGPEPGSIDKRSSVP